MSFAQQCVHQCESRHQITENGKEKEKNKLQQNKQQQQNCDNLRGKIRKAEKNR